MNKHSYAVKIAGASGQGINSLGKIVAEGLKNQGFRIFAYREYPSLIRGGYASYQIDIGDREINSSKQSCDILLALGRSSLHKYLDSIAEGGILIHALPKVIWKPEEKALLQQKNIKVEYVNALEISQEIGKSYLFANIVIAGVLWKILDLDLGILKQEIEEEYADKPKLLELDLQAVDRGYQFPLKIETQALVRETKQAWGQSLMMTGNASLSLGAIAAGTRAYYSYPMTPASSILSYMADWAHDTGILVKQAEDEITAAEMALGSMHMGTRALVATSGGGFDLMTETLSLAGMIETPFVCVIAQRPGPATGLPTWSGAGDLNLAVYAGHGEFPRCVIAASDVVSAYNVIQDAYNLAEEYQIPVLVLTEKQIAESLYNFRDLPAAKHIKRNLVDKESLAELKSEDRYQITETGISKRWLPGEKAATYDANSDEHLPDGSLTEDAVPAAAMIAKRMRKLEALKQILPEPELFGSEDAQTIMVGWGSVRSAVLDALEMLAPEHKQKFAYLHYEYIYPLKTELLEKLLPGKQFILVENNYTGQLGNLLRQETDIKFVDKLLKYDGRPFFVDDILEKLKGYV